MVDRIIFANTLRGFAAILVLISHFVGIFFVMNPAICDLLGVPRLKNLPPLPEFLSFIADNCIIFGQFGVGVFFIVSGLVVPFSLKNGNLINFIFRRGLRIYPVYIVGFSFAMFVLYLLAFYLNVEYHFSLFNIVAHFGIVTRGPLDVPRIDGISWTLEIEVYFYLILCLLSPFVLNFGFKRYLIALTIVASLAVTTFKMQESYLVGVQVASGLMLLVGMAYYSLINKKITELQFGILQMIVFALIPILWLAVAQRAEYTYLWMSGYLLAIVVFHVCFLLREKFTQNRIFEHFADISYPLYVVHALFGYAIMYVFIGNGYGSITAILAASLASYAMAVAIHLTIEKPLLRWSKSRKISISKINSV